MTDFRSARSDWNAGGSFVSLEHVADGTRGQCDIVYWPGTAIKGHTCQDERNRRFRYKVSGMPIVNKKGGRTWPTLLHPIGLFTQPGGKDPALGSTGWAVATHLDS